jgi:hypothetical protein
MDRLNRHLRRCAWLEKHPDRLQRVTRVNLQSPKVIPLLVTSTVVPMQFTKELPLPADNIVPISRLIAWVSQRTGNDIELRNSDELTT